MLKLAQATADVASIEMGLNSVQTSSFNIMMFAVPFLFMIAILVFWIIALIGAAGRKDLKENRWLWIILLIFVGYIGVVIYFFVENRKKMGWASIILLLLMILSGFLFML